MNKNGGLAFPYSFVTQARGGSPTEIQNHSGMTLRDYFAGQALNGVLASENPQYHYMCASNKKHTQSAARKAYEMADAMLAEREKGE
jgi:hypothetical protein